MLPLADALALTIEDPATRADVELLWPYIEDTVRAVADAIRMPMWILVNERIVCSVGTQYLTTTCLLHLSADDTATACAVDAALRARREADNRAVVRAEACHAGMSTYVREIATSAGYTVAIHTVDGRSQSIAIVMSPEHQAMLEAMCNVMEVLLKQTTGYRSSVVAMAHELGQALVAVGVLAQGLQSQLASGASNGNSELSELAKTADATLSEARLGLYVIRNFLAHHSPYLHDMERATAFRPVSIGALIEEMVALHSYIAGRKGVAFSVQLPEVVPTLRWDELELRRLLHNVIGNAVKYSYRSGAVSHRTINVRTRIPYDPGFKERRWAIVIENYGIGLMDGEAGKIGNAGYRGDRARREVPVGSGLGISEAKAILKNLGGSLRMRFRRLHLDDAGRPVDLVTAEMILPLGGDQ